MLTGNGYACTWRNKFNRSDDTNESYAYDTSSRNIAVEPARTIANNPAYIAVPSNTWSALCANQIFLDLYTVALQRNHLLILMKLYFNESGYIIEINTFTFI